MISDHAAALAILLEKHSRSRVRQFVTEHENAINALPGRVRLWRSRLIELRQRCQELDVSVTAAGEAGFPGRLTLIPDPPLVVFQRGNCACFDRPAVAIVGARRASRLGLETARTLARTLASSGIVVVSGLALGIDSAAHQGVLEASPALMPGGSSTAGSELTAGGQTIAVLGSGLACVAPVTNIPLAEAIVDHRGMLLSEYPIGLGARPHHFPERNRLISGLADVLVVIEAGERSGSLITARLALEQGREVLAVPGAISLPGSRGVNWLLKQGAGVVDSAQDVFAALAAQGLTAGESAGAEDPSPPDGQLTSAAARVLDAVQEVATTLDELCVSSGESAARVAVLLAELELNGFVARSGGGYIRRPFTNSSSNRP